MTALTFFLLIGMITSCESVDPDPVNEIADYYVSPSGNNNNPGTFDKPWATWQKAVNMAKPGNLIYIRGGTYRTTKTTGNIVDFTNLHGTAGNLIKIWAYPGEKPILNMDDKKLTGYTDGLHFYNTDYIHLKGLRITGMPQTNASSFTNGLSMAGYCDNNIIEACEFDHMCIGCGIWNTLQNSGNLVLNCDAHHCSDPLSDDPNGGADGFGCYWGSWGYTNTFRGCRSWWVTDDGFDDFKNNGTVITDSCWSFRNGYIPGTMTFLKGATGYKMGYSENPTQVTRVYTHCLAFDVTYIGFSSNDANSLIHIYNCTAYRNGSWGIRFTGNLAFTTKNCISFNNSTRVTAFDYTHGAESTVTIHDHNSWETGKFYAPSSWNDNITSGNDFLSLDTTGVTGQRGPNGELPVLNFLRLKAGSRLIDAGVYVGLPYLGADPDLGAFEIK